MTMQWMHINASAGEVKHPMGALCEMAQFSRKLLCFPDVETRAVRVPYGINQVEDFCDVDWQYTDREVICINYEPEHSLFRGND